MRHLEMSSQKSTILRAGLTAIAALFVASCSNPSSDPFKGDEDVKKVVDNAIDPKFRVATSEQTFKNSALVDASFYIHHFEIGKEDRATWLIELKPEVKDAGVKIIAEHPRPRSGDLNVIGKPIDAVVNTKVTNAGRSVEVTMTWTPKTGTPKLQNFRVVLNPEIKDPLVEDKYAQSSHEVALYYKAGASDHNYKVQDYTLPETITMLPVGDHSRQAVGIGATQVWKITILDINSSVDVFPKLSFLNINNTIESAADAKSSTAPKHFYRFSIGHLLKVTEMSHNAKAKKTTYTIEMSVDEFAEDAEKHFKLKAHKDRALANSKILFYANLKTTFVDGTERTKNDAIHNKTASGDVTTDSSALLNSLGIK